MCYLKPKSFEGANRRVRRAATAARWTQMLYEQARSKYRAFLRGTVGDSQRRAALRGLFNRDWRIFLGEEVTA